MKKTNNFRFAIYESYESKFNRIIDNVDEKSILRLFKHYEMKILPWLKLYKTSSNILELGCGPGYMLRFLKNNGYNNTTGIDISNEQVELAKSKGFNVYKSDVFEFLSNNKTKWDVIFALDFVEHFSKEELFEMMELIYNNLESDGCLIIRTPNAEGLLPNTIIYGDLTHSTILTQNSLSQLLKYFGFNNLIFFENSPIPKNFKGIFRTIFWNFIKVFVNFIKIVETGTTQKLWSQDFYCIAKKNVTRFQESN